MATGAMSAFSSIRPLRVPSSPPPCNHHGYFFTFSRGWPSGALLHAMVHAPLYNIRAGQPNVATLERGDGEAPSAEGARFMQSQFFR